MHNNQRGLSLVEILAGIVLLGIITTLTTIIITNSFDRNDTSAKEISLKQDTNLMISQLRKEFYDGKDAAKPDDNIICLDDQQGRVQVNLETSRANGKQLESENGKVCIKGFDRHDPLRLKVFTENDNGKQINIETTLKKGGNKKISYGNTDGDMDPCDSTAIDWEKAKTATKLPCGEKLGTYKISEVQGDFENLGECTVKGDLLVTEQFQPKNLTLKVTGNACFLNQVSPTTSELNIHKNAGFKKNVQIEKESDTEIGRSAYFHDNFQLKNADSERFYIGRNAFFSQQFEIEHNAFIEINNDVFFQGKTLLQSNSTLIVKGNLEALSNQDFQLQNDSSLYVHKNAQFYKVIQKKNNSRLCIKGIVTPSSVIPDDQKSCDYM